MGVAQRIDGSDWHLLMTTELPDTSFCNSVANERQQDWWHAWNVHGYCAHHSSLKAPAARVVANRRADEAWRQRYAPRPADDPRQGEGRANPSQGGADAPTAAVMAEDRGVGVGPSRPRPASSEHKEAPRES